MAKVSHSLSPSMDIQVSSNFERLLYDLYDRRPEDVKSAMRIFREEGHYTIKPEAFKRFREVFSADRCDDEQTIKTIKQTYENFGYILDPHSAAGFYAAENFRNSVAYNGEPIVTLATAHPAKFPDTVKRAIGISPPVPERLKGLYEHPERVTPLENDYQAVTTHITHILKQA